MIYLPKETIELLEERYTGTKIRADKVLFRKPSQKVNVTIPSKLYPLSNQRTIALFSVLNTEPILNDLDVQEVFDSLTLEAGRCYTNTENIAKGLRLKGIKDEDFETYVGWILDGGLPIHHCWSVYKGKHVLDGGIGRLDLEFSRIVMENEIIDEDEQRKLYAELYVEEAKKPNSVTRTFGQVMPNYIYVGTKTNREEDEDEDNIKND